VLDEVWERNRKLTELEVRKVLGRFLFSDEETLAKRLSQLSGGVLISAKTGAGLPALRQLLLQVVGWLAAPEGVFMARERHVRALHSVQADLETAAAQLGAACPALDLLAEDLRQAQLHLSAITGAFTADDLLGEIFSSFCIGK
jgi:tRNA modification GTPase